MLHHSAKMTSSEQQLKSSPIICSKCQDTLFDLCNINKKTNFYSKYLIKYKPKA